MFLSDYGQVLNLHEYAILLRNQSKMQTVQPSIKVLCYHCGDECKTDSVRYNDKDFCCQGCRAVYELLNENELCNYYDYYARPGLKPQGYSSEKWNWLEDEDIEKSLCSFTSPSLNIITLHIPGVHCASCIYLLEKLPQMLKGVNNSEIDFLKKELIIRYNPANIRLQSIVDLLSRLGYTPSISMQDGEKKQSVKIDRSLIYKIGVAGFCFANIMMLSLAEYFDWKNLLTPEFNLLFRILNSVLALPVIFYSATEYFVPAWKAITRKHLSMEVPIAIGLAGIIIQSYYEIITNAGNGYLDSFSGLVFMLLIGKFIQRKTFASLNFDRDYKSYFPMAVTRIVDGREISTRVSNLRKNSRILVRMGELVPADSILEEDMDIDYSFVTGESEPVLSPRSSLAYAGGRNAGSAVRMITQTEVQQSYLTKLWNNDSFRKDEKMELGKWSSRMAVIFTVAVLCIAGSTTVYWAYVNPPMILRTVTSVLVIACPCVLALTVPFTFGAALSAFSKKGLYLKNAESLESLASADTIVFDKTGTLTRANESVAEYKGQNLTPFERGLIVSSCKNSMHPISRILKESFSNDMDVEVDSITEISGKGLTAILGNHEIKIGNEEFVKGFKSDLITSGTWLSIDGTVKGYFEVKHSIRSRMNGVLSILKKKFNLYVLSGDSPKDANLFSGFSSSNLYFKKNPHEKMEIIRDLKKSGKKVIMIGDGLNDAGALKESNFGITVTEDVNAFSPSSDAILDANYLYMLPSFAGMANAVKWIIYGSFVFSTIYNIFGISFAVRGLLAPWVAAVLMPISSITVVLYSQLAVYLAAKKYNLK